MSSDSHETPLVTPADRAEWREWLVRNHRTSNAVRLAVGKKGRQATALTYEDAVEEALCFGWIDGKTQRLDDDRFTIRMTPRRAGSIWAASNKERVSRLMARGLMAEAGIAAVERAKTDGSWTLLDDVDALVIPEDLSRALAETPGADAGFSALAASMRKQLLYWVVSAKRPSTRERRIAEIVLAAAEGRAPR